MHHVTKRRRAEQKAAVSLLCLTCTSRDDVSVIGRCIDHACTRPSSACPSCVRVSVFTGPISVIDPPVIDQHHLSAEMINN